MSEFYKDVKEGLSKGLKNLPSKYFYDKVGDALFQKLMHSKAYYLSRCELSILKEHADDIAQIVADRSHELDLVELGAGDASKSIYLLRAFQQTKIDFIYYPIDISKNVITHLNKKFTEFVPSMRVHGLNGDYVHMLKKQRTISQKPMIILFLGSNIGNMTITQANDFCKQVSGFMRAGDFFLIGVDLKKDPDTILRAYNDPEGITRAFNLNLLTRINNELEGNFNTDKFSHFPLYDPVSGECKSYLISTEDQKVHIGSGSEKFTVNFAAHEPIHMEISKKFDLSEIDQLAEQAGFKITKHFFDDKKCFVNSLWQKC